MKAFKLLALAALTLFFVQCKTAAPTAVANDISLVELKQILDTTQSKFIEFADSTAGNPEAAIAMTANWLATQPTVRSADATDGTYINIVLKSGIETIFSIDRVDDNGMSLFRGGGSADANEPTLSVTATKAPKSKNTITNKKVLIFSAAHQQFYTKGGVETGEMQRILDRFTNSTLGLQVTLLKDEQCTPAVVQTFKDYGLVIIDTHGQDREFMSGMIIDISNATITADQIKKAIVDQAGQDIYDKIISGQLKVWDVYTINSKIPNWQKRLPLQSLKRIAIGTKFIEALPEMSNTVIFGNMCNSGATTPSAPLTGSTVKNSFMTRNPISYYGYAFADGKSRAVTDLFSKRMEDSIVRRFVENFDSTRVVNLTADNFTEYYDLPVPSVNLFGNLYFKHFGADDYSYGSCLDSFIDARDGHLYHSICIGKQNWMKENLAYNAPGSRCYDDNLANCDIYGRLYDWATMLQGAAPSSSTPSGVQGVCPKGWHVPSQDEYYDMLSFLSDPINAGNDTIVGGMMKAISPLWNQGPNVGATNSSGFTALPGGSFYNNKGKSGYSGIGESAEFWMSNLDLTNTLFPVSTGIVNIQNPNFSFVSQTKAVAVSCRCLKD